MCVAGAGRSSNFTAKPNNLPASKNANAAKPASHGLLDDYLCQQLKKPAITIAVCVSSNLLVSQVNYTLTNFSDHTEDMSHDALTAICEETM